MSVQKERPTYYDRIEKALKDSGRLASAMEAMEQELRPKRFGTDIRELIRTLRGQPTAEQFIMDGSKAMWLPLMLRTEPTTQSSGDFKKLFEDLLHNNEIRRSNWLRFGYPLMVLAMTIGLFVLLAHTVIVTFQAMFQDFQLRLPVLTQLVMGVANVIRTQPFRACLWLIGIVLVFIGARKTFSLVVRQLESTALVGPLLSGNLESVRSMGRFTATLAELLHIGAPLDEAIVIAGRASQNPRFALTSKILSQEISNLGWQDSKSQVSQNFPPLLFQALRAGPDRSLSVPLLRQLSNIYFERVRHRSDWSEGVLVPLSIIGIGFVVGLVVIALFLPLISLLTSLS